MERLMFPPFGVLGAGDPLGGHNWAQPSNSGPLSLPNRSLNPRCLALPPPRPSKRKFTSWARKQSLNTAEEYGNGNGHGQERDNVEDVMARLIFQACVDFETQPMVVFNASALPDPKRVDYDVLLAASPRVPRALRRVRRLHRHLLCRPCPARRAAHPELELGQEGVSLPGEDVLLTYRKNLKRLYIVHSSFWSKMLFSLAGAIIPLKFFRKLVYIPTLSEFAAQVHTDQCGAGGVSHAVFPGLSALPLPLPLSCSFPFSRCDETDETDLPLLRPTLGSQRIRGGGHASICMRGPPAALHPDLCGVRCLRIASDFEVLSDLFSLFRRMVRSVKCSLGLPFLPLTLNRQTQAVDTHAQQAYTVF
ncbi:hypothetical protein B0H14DRAFT_3678811 [Mycena olivaceomarginata]|nr:hypothetical protein B0H14DRAFT_3678811 [Mycena olivaceomarginata]